MRKFFILSCIWLLTIVPALATTYYVDGTNGNDVSNNGQSLAAAFKTIQKAASVAVAGDVILVRAGTYRESIVPANSGTASQPIIYQPYNNETVVISGAELLTGWTVHSGNIYKANLAGNFMDTSHNQTDQIFINGSMVSLARWPNNSNLDPSYPKKSPATSFVSKNTNASTNVTTVVFTDTKLPNGSYNGAEIYVQPNTNGWSWTLTGKISSVSGSQVTMTSYSSIGDDGNFSVYDQNFRYFLYNKLSLLDTAGEWFHDKQAGLLYLWCPGNANPASVTVEAKKREYAFNLSNRSYITVKGFTLFACTITTDTDAGGSGQAYDANGQTIYPWRGFAAGVAPSSHCTIDGINAKYLSHFTDCSGFMANQWCQGTGLIIGGSDHVVTNCNLQYSGGNGISIMGRRNKALNNTITDMNYMAVECAAIAMGVEGAAISEDHEAGYNTITRTGRSGLTCRQVINSNTNNLIARIHHNDISHFMLQDEDGAGIYWATADSRFLRIDHNRIHDGEGYSVGGVYPDFVKNTIIDHNIIWNVEWGVHLQGDNNGVSNHLVYNNTIAVKNTSGTPFGPFNIGNSGNGVQVGTICQNNICVYRDGNSTTPTAGYLPFSSQFNSNAILTTNFTGVDALFTNFSAGDFTLQNTSPCINAGTLMQAVVRDGVTVPAFNDPVTGTVDIGALESSVAGFAGKIWTNMPDAASNVSVADNIAITDGNKTADITFPSANQNYYQGAGIIWTTTKNINKVIFTNGTYAGGGSDDGCFEANFKLQTSTNGTTWTDATGWTLSPPYAYSNSSVSGADFTFTGTASNILGVRVVGQVHTNASSGSWLINAREIAVDFADTLAPTQPIGLNYSAVTTTSFTLTWQSSVDNVGVTGYDVFKDGVYYSSVTGTSANITGLAADVTYAMTVKAKDAAGNISVSSSAINVTTESGLPNIALNGNGIIWVDMPDAVSNATATTTPAVTDGNKLTDIAFTDASENYYQGVGVVWATPQNNVSRVIFTHGTYSGGAADNGCFEANFKLQISTDGTTWTDATSWTLTPAYAYSNVAVNGATFRFNGSASNIRGIRVVGQVHTNSSSGSWQTSAREFEVLAGSASDTQAPTVPAGLSSSAITSNSFTLSWTASTDNVGVTSYDVYRNGSFYSNVTSTLATVTGLSASTTYSMTVRAKDAAGNNSAFSSALNVTTSSSLTNIASTGTGKIWQNMSSATTNSSSSNNAAIIDGNKTTDIVFTDANLNYYQGAGVTWSTAKNNITQVTFTNGSYTGSANDNGCFEANFRLQTSNNGTNWSNANGWTLTPSYTYSNAAVSGTSFTFSGSTVNNVRGIRVVGQVHTNSSSGSWAVNAREIEVFSTSAGAKLKDKETDADKILSEIINIYPNPTAGNIKISTRSFTKPVQVTIRSTDGRVIFFSGKLLQGNSLDVNLEKYPSGIYMVEVTDGEKRFVKRVSLLK